jgi:hypothetical protein
MTSLFNKMAKNLSFDDFLLDELGFYSLIRTKSRDDEVLDQQGDIVIVFGLHEFCQFEARVPVFDVVCSVQCTQYRRGGGCVSNSGTLAPNRQNKASTKYNDDISWLISKYLISEKSKSKRRRL